LWENIKDGERLKDVLGGRIILIWDMMLWTGFMWFRTWTAGELLWTMEGCQFHMMASVPCSGTNAIKILRTSPIKFINGRNLKPRFHVDGHEIKRKKY
jgi:hypothetical protein